MSNHKKHKEHEAKEIEIRVEDDRTGMSPETLRRAVLDHLHFTQSKILNEATPLDLYFALAHTVRDRLMHRWMHTNKTYHQKVPKRLYYLSAEYLVGRSLLSNILNLGLYDIAEQGLRAYGVSLSDALEQEPDPGLGNGGLGRLAACFLDSLATLGLPAVGYGIRYEFGIFRQTFRDGQQVELPDEWLLYGNPWEIARPEYTVSVQFYGHVQETWDKSGHYIPQWVGGQQVLGVPYDTPIAGYGNNTVNTLRLWSARASSQFDLEFFNAGDYRRAVEQKAISESISKVLYPKDDTPDGRELRLKQQYFFACCSIQDIIRRYKHHNDTFDHFPDKVAIQLNDTHPSIAIAELQRVLVDLEQIPWDRAWDITQRTFAYTNHTLLPEALEQWPLSMFQKLLPRHTQIIFEINRRFLRQVQIAAPHDEALQKRMSIIGDGPEQSVRMAHLSVVGSHSVNGVAQLHTDLLKQSVLRDFADFWPTRFNNKTNGVTPRRWLLQCNPLLSKAISDRIGTGWVTHLEDLKKLESWAEDPALQEQLHLIKQQNKQSLAQFVRQNWQIQLNPHSLFDIQIKRMHEYKRQLLNCLHVIALYQHLKFNPEADLVPRTVIFAGKAAPGYTLAKLHIKFINDVANTINQDPKTNERLKMIFVPNYSVSLAERLIPAADLSEQISTAGKEASGTGNMKFQMNGALTIGTLDGANIEIREEVGADNFFLFGLNAQEVQQIRHAGYRPSDHVEQSEALRHAIHLVRSGFFSPDEPDRYHALMHNLTHIDHYLICADFESYRNCQQQAEAVYKDRSQWMKRVIHNIANAGKFSSDRTIAEYAREIWQLESIQIILPEGHDDALLSY